jgi:hypothetical protein
MLLKGDSLEVGCDVKLGNEHVSMENGIKYLEE